MEEFVPICEGGSCKARADQAEIAPPPIRKDTAISGGLSPVDQSNDDQQEILPKSNRRKKEKDTKSSIINLHGQHDLDMFISANNYAIVEFMTSWCGSCKAIKEYYEELSLSNQEDVLCAKVVCDKNKQTKKLAAAYSVKSYPVFIAFKDRTVSNRFDGADRGKLESTFERVSGGGSGGKKKNRGGRSKRK